MRRIAALLLPLLTLAAQPLAAQEIGYEAVAFNGAEVSYLDYGESDAEPDGGAERLLAARATPAPPAIAAYGPFRVLDGTHAALVDVTDAASPDAFAAMLREHPGIAVLDMVSCPGTEDDRANLRLGLMIHDSGIATHVPDDGFVGSGAVELFLAGVHRYAEPGAEFAVHSWEDETGHQPGDYAPDAPQNRAYLDYYRAMGLTAPEAKAFYAMTNSVPFAEAKWLTRADLAQWVRLDTAMPVSAPTTLAVLDSIPALQ
ncbi:MAG: alpha/beta hydrolase [Sphingomonadales bacterium]|nr:alpha/beta hydrolase [Sphingomonadales bacterium]